MNGCDRAPHRLRVSTAKNGTIAVFVGSAPPPSVKPTPSSSWIAVPAPVKLLSAADYGFAFAIVVFFGPFFLAIEPAPKPISVRNLLLRALLFIVSVLFIRGIGIPLRGHPSYRALCNAPEWPKAVRFYSPASESLCVDTPAGYEVLALKEIGASNAVGVAKKWAPPLAASPSDSLVGMESSTSFSPARASTGANSRHI